MKIGSFTKVKKFVPTGLGNAELPESEQFYFDIATMENTDFFEANAIMLKSKARYEEAGDPAGPEIDDGKGGKRKTPTSAQALIHQDSARIVVEGFGKIVTKYVKVANLFDGEGNPLSAEDLVKYPEFVDTVIETMNFILGISQPDDTSTKNS